MSSESDVGIIDAADLLVTVTKAEDLPPQPKRYSKICVLATKTEKGQVLDGKLIFSKEEVKNDIVELDELNFKGSLKIWNTELTAEAIQAMQGYGLSLVVLSGRSGDVKGMDTKDMIVWFTQTDDPNAAVQASTRCGVMLDTQKQGHCLFALSRLLYDPENFAYTAQIQNNNFVGVNDIERAKVLDEAGVSYFFKANDLTWLRGFWLGSEQARAVYADKSVEYDIRQTVAALVAKGLAYTEENLALIETKILQTLKENNFIDTILSVLVPRNQKASNKVQGKVTGVKVQYKLAQEVRTVEIELV